MVKHHDNSKIETKGLNNLSDSWKLKLIFGLVNSNQTLLVFTHIY